MSIYKLKFVSVRSKPEKKTLKGKDKIKIIISSPSKETRSP